MTRAVVQALNKARSIASANRLRRALIGRPHTVVVNVPYRREDEHEPEPAPPHP